MTGPYVHNIDPVIADIGGFYLWWYGLSYTLGFIGLFLWIRRHRRVLQMSMGEVYSLTLYTAGGVLLGGRLVEVFFYEWASYYSSNPWHIPAVWLGGMSTHGILLGASIGIWIFCRLHRKSFLAVGDVLAIAGMYIMGVGRLGNFIDGQIVGSVTDVMWAVRFPDAEGFRHPVVIYDGLKNLLLIPLLLFIRSRKPPRGVVLAHGILWYGFLRIFIDLFRYYPTTLFGLPPGQEFNVGMTLTGIGLLLWCYRKNRVREEAFRSSFNEAAPDSSRVLIDKRVLLGLLLIFPLVMPSDWTQDVPERYGKRHPGMSHSIIYPEIDTVTPSPPSRNGGES